MSEKNKKNFELEIKDESLSFPFILIRQLLDSNYVIKQDDETNARFCILSETELDLMDSDDICRKLLKKE